MKAKKFSAFRLFYDEMIYKNNSIVDYLGIENNVSEIRNIAHKIRNTFFGDKDKYYEALNEAHADLKNELTKIYNTNNSIFEVYYSLYKENTLVCNDKLEDMGFVIATSFYNDYRLLEDGTLDESILIPRFTSLEKKNLRDYEKQNGLLQYFVYLLGNCRGNYSLLINKIKYLSDMEVNYNETLITFKKRYNDLFEEVKEVLATCEEKARKSNDFYYVKDAIDVVKKNKYKSWLEFFNSEFELYYKTLYEKCKREKDTIYVDVEKNDISFDTFEKYCSELVLEKEKYMDLINKNGEVSISVNKKDYYAELRLKLLEEYFDKRLYFKLREDISIEDLAIIGYNLSMFGKDLEVRIFEKNKFDASYSRRLNRNNDVRSAIVRKLYELYDPYYLITVYGEKREEYDKFLNSHGNSFLVKVRTIIDKIAKNDKEEFDLVTVSKMESNLVNRRKQFVLDNVDDIESQDIFEYYDTRNYDLEVMLDAIDTNNLVKLYKELKKKINNNEFSKNTCICSEYSDKKSYLLNGLVDLFTRVIARKETGVDLNKDAAIRIRVYKDIAFRFLNESIYVDIHEEDNKRNAHAFNVDRELFNIDSNYSKLKKLL